MADLPRQGSGGGSPGRKGYLAEGCLYLSFLVVSYLALGGVVPSVHFTSELIRITVDDQNLHVDGIYRYRNPFPFPVVQGLSCPTPSGDGLSPVEDVMVQRLPVHPDESPVFLPVRRVGGTPYFEVSVPGRRTVSLRVRYAQRHSGARGRYLLTTTANWRRPLVHGRYELRLVSSHLVRSSYPLADDAHGSYHFHRTEFMPEKDWVFEFASDGGG